MMTLIKMKNKTIFEWNSFDEDVWNVSERLKIVCSVVTYFDLRFIENESEYNEWSIVILKFLPKSPWFWRFQDFLAF